MKGGTLRYELNHVAEDRLLEAGLSLHAGMMRAERQEARRHLADALDALDQAIREIRLAIIDLDDGIDLSCDGRRQAAS